MKHRFGGDEYDVTFRDFEPEGEYKRRHFSLKDAKGIGYVFTIHYKFVNGFPQCKCVDTGFPEVEQRGVLYLSLGI